MAQLRRDQAEFERRETTIIVVGPEDANNFRKYWQEHDLQFIGIPDPKHSVLKLYGQQIKIFKFGRMPAQVLVDKMGMARFVHYGLSMSDIPDNAGLFVLIDLINAENQRNLHI